MSKKKPPAKKPAKTTRDGKPVKFPPTWGTLARNTGPFPDATMPPAKPVKAARVKRPKPRRDMWIPPNRLLVYFPSMSGGIFDATEARARAAWLLHAAAYIEQEARRKE